ncbi:Uma2 family endonuclease [Nostoc sp. FACHB-152]|uniref:Uma2 family endonuclease n=1 Tax=unclassified Nostoc TaxID=2593658 RepID=UPI0016892517|nr:MULTISPECIES: Uma2 family endonuclease [unclassified Nostoc]MBD2449422.1 Uma2 family endonuclease [Nostoc sp. FACHB-152]MBD2470813.1 Uma2 family endonuclease [Nostoc sp. FACHB-145]
MVLTPQQLDAMMPDASQLYSDEPEMESSLHAQLLILVTCLEWLWRDRNDYFIGANLTIYFSRQQLRNRDFRAGSEYQEISPNVNGWYWSQELGLYLGIDAEKLRYFTAEGALVPTPEEAALQAQSQLQQERERAERLAERLRSLGIEDE